MSIIRLATSVKNAMLTPLATAINAGSAGGMIKIYTATMPALPSDAITTQVLLGTLTFSDPCGSVANGSLTMSSITQDSSADASGVAAWARISDSDGVVIGDIDITTTGGGGAMQMNTTNVVIGGPILISSFVFSL